MVCFFEPTHDVRLFEKAHALNVEERDVCLFEETHIMFFYIQG